jgi:hypothetical protein
MENRSFVVPLIPCTLASAALRAGCSGSRSADATEIAADRVAA